MKSKNEQRFQMGANLAMALVALIMVIPFILLVMSSLTSNTEITLHGYTFSQKNSAWKPISIYGMKEPRFSRRTE